MRLLAALAGLTFVAPAHAQDAPPPESRGGPAPQAADDWTMTVGVAALVTPSWLGSNDITLSLVPDVRVNYRDDIFASIPEGLGWNAINSNGWKIGPVVKVRFGRDEDDGGSPFLIAGGSDDLEGMGDIDPSAELGGFVEKRFGNRDQWRIRTEVLQGFGGHDGIVAHASLDHRARLGRVIANFGPRITIVGEDFMDTYYGINDAQSGRTGLAPYDADGGILTYGLGGSAVLPLSRSSALTAFGTVENLGGEAAHSPLVEDRGQRFQFAVGLGYGYRFGL